MLLVKLMGSAEPVISMSEQVSSVPIAVKHKSNSTVPLAKVAAPPLQDTEMMPGVEVLILAPVKLGSMDVMASRLSNCSSFASYSSVKPKSVISVKASTETGTHTAASRSTEASPTSTCTCPGTLSSIQTVPSSKKAGMTFSSASENSIAATSEVNSRSEHDPSTPSAVKQTSKSTSLSGREVGIRLFSNQLTVMKPALGLPMLPAVVKPVRLVVRLVT